MIPVFKPLITKDERKAADKSLEIGWLGMGKYVDKFENKIKSIIGNKKKFVVSVNTGHSALHLIMMLIGLKKGDEVITPSFNNIADIQAILAVGAKPVFCDILEETLCIDIVKAEKLINKKTKAIIAMDYGSCLADHSKIKKIAKKHNYKIITTEKDFLRLDKIIKKNINFLKIKIKISDKKNLSKIIKKI